jgi:hypothetical protein
MVVSNNRILITRSLSVISKKIIFVEATSNQKYDADEDQEVSKYDRKFHGE